MQYRFLILLLLPVFLFAYEGYIPSTTPNKPWFTGPLISASGNITPKGHWNIEPYLFATASSAVYNNDWSIKDTNTLWTLQNQVPTFIGLTEWADIRFFPVWNWKHRDHAANWSLGDMNIQVDFQLYSSSFPPKNWLPSIRLSIREALPTGKYRNLNPEKNGTDAGGNGAWLTTLHLSMSRIFTFANEHFLNVLFNVQYGLPSPVHIKGFNAYGGGIGTNGTLYPEKICRANFGFEYNLDRNWALALDVVGVFNSTTRFSGNPGVTEAGLAATNARKALIQYSLAPAIEYNWSDALGLIAGCWLTVAGKNSAKFTSGVIAINYSK